MSGIVAPGKRVYAPNANKDDEPFEDAVVMGINPEVTHAMVDFEDGENPVIVTLESLEPACKSCGGMITAGCCEDPK